MALTVEELQIVLSCDATTAQKVLDQMNATVKAYTEKFQKYFDKMGSGNGPKDLASDVRAIEKTIGPVKKALGDIQRNEYKVGKTLSTEEMASQIAKNCAKATAETKAYFAKSEAEYQKIVNDVADNNQLIGLGAQMRGMLEDATSGIESMPEVLKYQVDQAAQSIKRLSEEYAKSVASSGENSKGSLAIKKKLEAAIITADKLHQKLLKLQTVSQEGGGAVVPGGQPDGGDLEDTSSKLSIILSKASAVGHAIKKAFNHTILGKFLNRLRTVMMRMAAMALIRGVINGAKQGLQELAKQSESSAKAMNTLKAAGGSIKMALGAALMPIVKALAPLFVRLAGAISSAGNAIARFFAVVTGQSTYTAVNFSDSLDGISDSAYGAGKSVKGMLADFDELIVIGKQSGGGGGGGTGVETSLSTVADLPAISALATKIREAIENGDWRGVGDAIGQKVNEAIENWNPEDSAHKLSDLVKNIVNLASGFLESTDFVALGEKVATFVDEIDWEGISDAIFEGIGAALGALAQFLWGLLKKGLQDAFDEFKEESFDENGDFDASGFVGWIKKGIGRSVERANFVEFLKDHVIKPLQDGLVRSLTNGEMNTVDEAWDNYWLSGLLNGTKEKYEGWFDDFLETLGISDGIDKIKTTYGSWWDDFWGWLLNPSLPDIGPWLQENIVDPVKNWLEDHFTLDLDLQLPDLTDFSTIWKGLKGGTKTFTAKLSGVKDTVIQKVQDNWNKIETKKAELTTVIQEGIETKVSSIKTAWNDLKAGTKTLTAKLAGTATSTFSSLKTSWESVKTKRSELTATLDQKFKMTDLTSIKDAFNSVKEKVSSTFTAKLDAAQTVKNFIDKWNSIKDLTVKLKAELADNFKSTWNSFADKWNGVSWLKTLFTMPKFAQGGVVYGPTMGLMGEYAGAKTNPEVIAPLSTLVDLLSKAGAAPGGSASQEQNDLLREQNRLLRQIAQKEFTISPSVQLGQVISRSQKLYART